MVYLPDGYCEHSFRSQYKLEYYFAYLFVDEEKYVFVIPYTIS